MIGSRLSEPLGYPNATAALFMTVAWLMVGLASRPWLPALARGARVRARGPTRPESPRREPRLGLHAAAGRDGLLPVRPWPPALAGTDRAGRARQPPVIQPGARRLQRRLDASAGALRHVIDLALVCAVLLARRAAGCSRSPTTRLPCRRVDIPRRGTLPSSSPFVVRSRLRRSSSPGTTSTRPGTASSTAASQRAASHFGGLGSNRYDFWRVGLIEFERHPVQGIGTDNFLVPYLSFDAAARSRSILTASRSGSSRRRASSGRPSSPDSSRSRSS